MRFQRLDLWNRTRGSQFCPAQSRYPIDRTGQFEKFFPGRRTESRQFFQDVFFHGFAPGGTVEGDGEPVGLVADFLDEHELRGTGIEPDGIVDAQNEEFLFPFRERAEVREFRSEVGFGGFRMRFEEFPNPALDALRGARQLSFAPVDDDHRRKIRMFESFQGAAFHDFPHALEVVDLVFFEGFELVFPVERIFRFPIDDDRAGSDRELAVGMGIVVALEGNRSFFGDVEPEFGQDVFHGAAGQGLLGEVFHFFPVGESQEIGAIEREQVVFRAGFRDFHADGSAFQEFADRIADQRFFEQKHQIGSVAFGIGFREVLFEDFLGTLVERGSGLGMVNPLDFPVPHFGPPNERLGIFFQDHDDVAGAAYGVPGNLFLPEHFDGLDLRLDFSGFFEFEIFGPFRHFGPEIRDDFAHLAAQEFFQLVEMLLVFEDFWRLEEAWGRAEADVVVHARRGFPGFRDDHGCAFVIRRELHPARSDLENLPQVPQRHPDVRPGSVRSEKRSAFRLLPGPEDFSHGSARHADVTEVLVVLHQDVVLGAVLLDEVGFEDEGFDFGGGFDPLDVFDLPDHLYFCGIEAAGAVEIRADAAFEAYGLADIEDFSRFPKHLVNAGTGRQKPEQVGNFRFHGESISECPFFVTVFRYNRRMSKF